MACLKKVKIKGITWVGDNWELLVLAGIGSDTDGTKSRRDSVKPWPLLVEVRCAGVRLL